MPKFSLRTGKSHQLVLEYTYILFDDRLFGPHTNKTVDLKYADGYQSQHTTDENGLIKVFANHGDFVDATIHIDEGTIQRRVFVNIDTTSTTKKAWQLLVNFGYVHEEQPPAEPTRKEIMASALEEFQFDHNIAMTGKLDNITQAQLDDFAKEETIWREHVWFSEEDFRCPGTKNQRESVT